MFYEMKDQLLVSVPKLLTACNTKGLLPSSMTEEHLRSITQDFVQGVDRKRKEEMTGLQLSAELCLQNIFLTTSTCILNCLLV